MRWSSPCIGPGALLGELAAIDGKPRSATATALEPMEALVVPGPSFREFLESHPRVALSLLEVLAGRLRDADRKRVEFGAYDTVGRVARRLVELAERFGQPEGGGVRIDVALTQDELAGWVGASRKGVGNALAELRGRGLLETRRRGITTGNGPAPVAFEPASAVTPDHGPGVRPEAGRSLRTHRPAQRRRPGHRRAPGQGADRRQWSGRGEGTPIPTRRSSQSPCPCSYDAGKEIGSVTHSFQCANLSCMILEDVDVYRLGDGDITPPGRVSVVHDPEHPGFVLTAARSAGDNITAATGRYAGRTGRVQVYGYVDVRGFPAQFVLDEVYVFELN